MQEKEERNHYILLDFWTREEKSENDPKKRQTRKTPKGNGFILAVNRIVGSNLIIAGISFLFFFLSLFFI